ncbi:uncharacterized protein LOC134679684 [Cydia fagiglandana]|uniref:uncharacterized protein LOC134679684 n=1 Tax=Cydia fagiglandana TaxID=1458189 RepID=UPI002FEE4297
MEAQFELYFEKMQKEMHAQTEVITTRITETIDTKLKPLIEENDKLKKKVDLLEKKVEFMEKEKKSNNIIIHGLCESEKSTTELINHVQEKFLTELNISLEALDINKMYRIGKNKKDDKPRPTLLSFVSGWKKTEIMRNKNKSKELKLTEDHSKDILERRKALMPQLMEERNKGNIAYIKYDKLIVKEATNTKENRKRELSISPSNNSQPKKQQTATPPINKKTNAFDLMRARSSSNSSEYMRQRSSNEPDNSS